MGLDMHMYEIEDNQDFMIDENRVGALFGLPNNSKEICYWRKHYKLNEFIYNNIYISDSRECGYYKENLKNIDVYNGSYTILTYSDILLIEKNIKTIAEHSYYSLDANSFKKKDREFVKLAKSSIRSGKLIVYHSNW